MKCRVNATGSANVRNVRIRGHDFTLAKEQSRLDVTMLGAIQVLRNAFFLKIGPPPTPRNANNVEPYTFITLFSGKFHTPPHLQLRYVTLEWPLTMLESVHSPRVPSMYGIPTIDLEYC